MRLVERGEVSHENINTIEVSIREQYGGDIYYLAKGCERDPDQGARNRSIIRDSKNGESIALLARRYRLSRRRIMQIIQG